MTSAALILALALAANNDFVVVSYTTAGGFTTCTLSGDVTAVGCVVTIAGNSIALGTDTTGNYAAGDAEAGNALTGDSATDFFSAGTFADARVDGSLEADEVVLAGDVDGAANANDLDEAAAESEIESVVDLVDCQGTLSIAKGGTGQTSATPAFDALAPTTTAADLIVHDGSDNVRLAKGQDGETLQSHSGLAPDVGWAHERLFTRLEESYIDNVGGATVAVANVGQSLFACGGATTANVDDASGPFGETTTGPVTGNVAGCISATFSDYRRDWTPDGVFRVKTGATITSVRYWVGFVSAEPRLSATPAIHLAAFRYDTATDGTAFWRACTDNGSGTPTCTATSLAVGASTAYTMRIRCDGTDCRFYDGVTLLHTETGTLPTATTQMGAVVGVTNVAMSARAIAFGRMSVTHE